MSASMVVGLDLGQVSDYSALAVVEHVHVLPAGTSMDVLNRQVWSADDGGVNELRVRHLQRWALGTPYDAIVGDISELMRSPELYESWLLFDATGVGRGIKDMFTTAFMDGRMGANWPIAKTITGEGQNSHGQTITKRDLMSVLQIALQQGRLKVAEELPLRHVLEEELKAFRLKITAAGRDTYEFKRQQGSGHGDLVIAVALAAAIGPSVARRVEVATAP